MPPSDSDRVTHGLVRLGHPVTAVDESEAMLAHVRGAEVIRGRIEELDLRRRFDTWRHPLVARLLDDDDSTRSCVRSACD
jgi:hypothetical protein